MMKPGQNIFEILQMGILLFAFWYFEELNQGCHLSLASKFPDFSPTIASDKSKKKKIIFILNFNDATCITSNLGNTLKGKSLLHWRAYSIL